MNEFFEQLNKVSTLDRIYFWGWMFLAAVLVIIWLRIFCTAARYCYHWLRRIAQVRNPK